MMVNILAGLLISVALVLGCALIVELIFRV